VLRELAGAFCKPLLSTHLHTHVKQSGLGFKLLRAGSFSLKRPKFRVCRALEALRVCGNAIETVLESTASMLLMLAWTLHLGGGWSKGYTYHNATRCAGVHVP
jgi:hypothetical protein